MAKSRLAVPLAALKAGGGCASPGLPGLSLQVYKGEETTFHISGLQVNTDYRFRVCACRRCLDTSQELSGPLSPSVAFALQRSALVLAGEPGGADDPKAKAMVPTDEQFAALIVLGFASLSIIFACILQYFFMK